MSRWDRVVISRRPSGSVRVSSTLRVSHGTSPPTYAENGGELGAAPGGWTQYVAARLGRSGYLLAVDILPMEPVEGATILQGDFTELEVLEQIKLDIDGRSVDLVLSDMAPNFTGQSAVDQPRSVYLAELALDMCDELLNDSGALLVKTFQGAGFEALLAKMKQSFASVRTRKPSASRARSREVYILAQR